MKKLKSVLLETFNFYKSHISRKKVEEKKDLDKAAFTTVYPPYPANDSNEWAKHIYKLCNN